MRWSVLAAFLLSASARADDCDRLRAMLEYNVKRPEAPGAAEKIRQYRSDVKECEAEAEAARKANEANAPSVDPEVQKVLNDKVGWQRAMSAYLCTLKKERAGYLKELATRRKYARLGGVEDMNEVYEIQQSIRSNDEEAAARLQQMVEAKAKPLSCTDRVVRDVLRCNEMGVADTCSDSVNLLVQATNTFSK